MSGFLQCLVNDRFIGYRRSDGRSSRRRVASDKGRFGLSSRNRFSASPTLVPDGSLAPVSSDLSSFSSLLLHELSRSVFPFCYLGSHLNVFGTGTVLLLSDPKESENVDVSFS